MSMKLIGSKRLARKFAAFTGAAMGEVQDAVAGSALLVQNDMRKSIQKGPATGRQYGRHQASAPGEAPATDSGRLVSHINFALSMRGMVASIGVHDLSNIVYARRLEFGGRDSRGIYIAPRPYARPALDKNIRKIVVKIGTAYKRAGRRLTRGS